MYKPVENNIWTGRSDTIEGRLGFRWHQIIEVVDLNIEQLPSLEENKKGIAILGFACDEGVRRNKGRTGAKDGPLVWRKISSSLANHFDDQTRIFDVGDIICNDANLEAAQTELRELVDEINSKGYFVFVIGGGHEVAFPHYVGIRKSLPTNKVLGIINIDAHFDLRLPSPEASSGTPFYQIAKYCNETEHTFSYFIAGIQRSGNTKALFKRADELGVTYMLSSEINYPASPSDYHQLETFIKEVDFIYLTICMDVFDISFAPGVSAPSAMGIQPEVASEIISRIKKSGKLVTANIAELNPSLDQDDKTARLASKLAFEILTD